jgi:hypothetical protein
MDRTERIEFFIMICAMIVQGLDNNCFRLKVWQHRTSLMKGFAHSAILHQLKQWFGVPNVMIFCVPIV